MSNRPDVPSLWSYLRQGRWMALIATMIAFSVACIFLGRWQFDRHHQKKDRVAQVEAVWDAPKTSLAEVTAGAGVDLDPAFQWQRIAVSGYWVKDSHLILRNRPVDGTQAGHVMRLFFVPGHGSHEAVVIPVEQGWAPADMAEVSPDENGDFPAPPRTSQVSELAGPAPTFAGEADSIVARIHSGEEYFSRDPAPGYVYTRNGAQMIEALGFRAASLTGFSELGTVAMANYYLLQSPPPTGSELAENPRPSSSLGNHLSYAFQWWFFALAGQAVAPILARREREDDLISARLARRGSTGEAARGEGAAASSDELSESGQIGDRAPVGSAGQVATGVTGEKVSGREKVRSSQQVSGRYAGAFISRRRRDGEDEQAEDQEIDSLL